MKAGKDLTKEYLHLIKTGRMTVDEFLKQIIGGKIKIIAPLEEDGSFIEEGGESEDIKKKYGHRMADINNPNKWTEYNEEELFSDIWESRKSRENESK